MEDEGPGGRDACIPPFKTPTLNKETLRAKDSMRDGYHSKMLLYALDELFYVYARGLSFWMITLGAQCWPGYISISTGAVTMQPIARHRC